MFPIKKKSIIFMKATHWFLFQLVDLDVDIMAEKLQEVVKPMQQHFSYKPGANYNHPLFFLSIAMHRVIDQQIKHVIMLDADLKVNY